jgi:hypothetical protein
MAHVYLKRKAEPLVYSAEKARKIKLWWVGDEEKGIEPQDRETKIDYGTEVFELHEIRRISIPEDEDINKPPAIDYEAERENQYRQNLLITVEERAKAFARFNTAWFMRSEMTQKSAPDNVLEEVYKLQLAHLIQNPTVDYCPPNITQHLLEKAEPVKEDLGLSTD